MKNSGIVDLVPNEVRQQWIYDGSYPNQSVFSLFCQHAEAQPNKLAVLSRQEHVTYGELLERSLRLATAFRNAGIVKGDVVAYQLTNSWRSCAIDLAVAALGAIVAPFPPGRGTLDIQSLVRRCDARAVIVPSEYAGISLCDVIESLRPTLLSLRILIVQGEERDNWVTLDDMFKFPPLSMPLLPQVDPNSAVRLLGFVRKVGSGTFEDAA